MNKVFPSTLPISSAPTDKTIIVYHPVFGTTIKVTHNGQSWVNEKGFVIDAEHWNPFKTQYNEDCSDISDMDF